jgi:hypothetical protein
MEPRVPRGIYGRRVFWALIVGGALLLFAARYLALPALRSEDVLKASDLLDQVLEDMLAAVLVAGVLIALLSYFAPEASANGVVEVVAAKDRGPRLDRARSNTRLWWFSGAMGRYTRAETLPGLASACREDGRSRTVVLQVIDPRDLKLCGRYANLRSSLRTADRTPWSTKHVQQEVLATIVAAYAVAAQQSQLDLQVALRSTVSQQRYDLSDGEVLITTEDERREALSFPAGSEFYDIIRDELRLSLAQAEALPELRSVTPSEMNLEHLDAMLSSLGLDGIELDLKTKQEILASVQHPSNPYA